MNYDEVLFILAEVNNDEASFRAGIKASAMNWGVSSSDAEALSNAVAYNGVESVITEKWVANYMQGIQGWSEYRRTGFPSFLMSPADGVHSSSLLDTKHIVPNRRPYPSDESQMNKVNYDAAVQELGGHAEEQNAKLFWQK